MKALLLILLLLLSNTLYAARVNTSEGNLLPSPTKEEIEQSADRVKIPIKTNIPESWVPYLNPAFEEFWTEGNHRPDTGFVLFARNPSVENAKLWLLRMETKATYLQVMFNSVVVAQKDLIKQGLIKDRYNSIEKARSLPPTKVKQNGVSKEELSELEIFFLFSSTCPHCKRLALTLKAFPNVSPLQVDSSEKLTNFESLPASEMATEDTKSAYLQTAEVPVLVIHDPTNKTVNILKGNRSQEEILLAMASLLNTRGDKK